MAWRWTNDGLSICWRIYVLFGLNFGHQIYFVVLWYGPISVVIKIQFILLFLAILLFVTII